VRAVFRAVLRDATPARVDYAVTAPSSLPARVPPRSLPTATGDRVRPVISRLRVSPRRWRLARGRTAKAAAVKRGTTISFLLSERARTTLRIERRSGRRWHAVVTLTRTSMRAGANSVKFTGRVGRRIRLRPGTHRLVVTAIDPAGNRSAAGRVGFTVVR
jgi:hypothetical protein